MAMATTVNKNGLFTPLTPSLPACPPIVERIETLPVTPPDSAPDLSEEEKSSRVDSRLVKKALHVISTERDALTHLEGLYATSPSAQLAFTEAVRLIASRQQQNGKVVFTGVGKSGWIAQKLVATFNSIGIVSIFVHATEALHGDLGAIRPGDVVLMITFSGKTQELMTLLPHIPTYVPLMVITSHTSPSTCPLLTRPQRASSCDILLPAPIHISETASFGLSAPTTSTTVALALGDSLALAVGDVIHAAPYPSASEVFLKNHPGGAIGASSGQQAREELTIADIGVKLNEITEVAVSGSKIRGFDVLRTAVKSSGGWVKLSPTHIIAPRRAQAITEPDIDVRHHQDNLGPLVIEHDDWISVPGDWKITDCVAWIVQMRTEHEARGRYFLKPGTILGVVDGNSQKSSVIEIEDIVGDDFCGTL